MREIPELCQFRFSHFNGKVRWALDYKGIAHRRRSLLPGPHARALVGRPADLDQPLGGTFRAGVD